MTDLIDTTEMYLRTILELEEEGIVPLRARIAERLHHSGPTVSQTIGRMERDGLVVVSGDRHLELTDLGREKSVAVMRKHRLAERLLSDVIGLDWQFIHEEACRWEHVMSDRVEQRLFELLDQPEHSPYGNPIPGLTDLGGDITEPRAENMVTVPSYIKRKDREADSGVLVRRLAEPLQVDPKVLASLAEAGVCPGEKITVSQEGAEDSILIESARGSISLPGEQAEYIFVETE